MKGLNLALELLNHKGASMVDKSPVLGSVEKKRRSESPVPWSGLRKAVCLIGLLSNQRVAAPVTRNLTKLLGGNANVHRNEF